MPVFRLPARGAWRGGHRDRYRRAAAYGQRERLRAGGQCRHPCVRRWACHHLREWQPSGADYFGRQQQLDSQQPALYLRWHELDHYRYCPLLRPDGDERLHLPRLLPLHRERERHENCGGTKEDNHSSDGPKLGECLPPVRLDGGYRHCRTGDKRNLVARLRLLLALARGENDT